MEMNMEMNLKRGVSIGLRANTIQELDKLVTLEGLPSRSELGCRIIEDYLSKKKIREKLI